MDARSNSGGRKTGAVLCCINPQSPVEAVLENYLFLTFGIQ